MEAVTLLSNFTYRIGQSCAKTVQSQRAVSGYFKWKQLLLSNFTYRIRQSCAKTVQSQIAVSAYFK